MQGFIKLHRMLLNWEWYTDVNTKTLFIHCLLKANFTDKKWRGITIKRGQFITSISSLSCESGLSLQQVRTALKKLEKTGEITRGATNKYTLLTVCNYESYQDNQEGSNKQITNKQQTNNNQITTTKEGKKERKKEKSVDKSTKPLKFANEFREIVKKFTETTGRRMRVPSTKTGLKKYEHYKKIKSVLAKGYTVEDVSRVVKYKNAEWGDDAEMKKNINLTTIARHFDRYYEQALNAKETKSDWGKLDEYLLQHYKDKHVKRFKTATRLFDYAKWEKYWHNKKVRLKFSRECESMLNSSKNPSLSKELLFEVCYLPLGENYAKNANKKLWRFKQWFSKLDDYKKRQKNIRKLFKEHRNR